MRKIYVAIFSAFVTSFSICGAEQPGCEGVRKVGEYRSAKERFKDPMAFFKDYETTVSDARLFTKWDPDLKTTIYYGLSEPLANGEIPLVHPDAKAIVVYFHGSGTAKSSGRNFVHNINGLTAKGVAALAVDLPFHGTQQGESRLTEPAEFAKWMDGFMRPLKATGKPIYLVGHSFGPEAIQEYVARFPKGITGIQLISPAWGGSPSHAWTYENITDPNMHLIGGETKVEENVPGGEWAGKIADRAQWTKFGIPEKVKVQMVVGSIDEWWPAVNPQKGLPKNVHKIEVKDPNKVPGNVGLAKATGVKSRYGFHDGLDWFREHVPHAEVNVVEGVGHYIFDAQTKDGKNVMDSLLQDFIDPTLALAGPNAVSDRTKVAMLEQHSPSFRSWITPGALKMAKSHSQDAKRTLDQWTRVQQDFTKQFLLDLKETDPDFYRAREFSIHKEVGVLSAPKPEGKELTYMVPRVVAEYRNWKAGQNGLLTKDRELPEIKLNERYLGPKAVVDKFGGALLLSVYEKGIPAIGKVDAVEPAGEKLVKVNVTLNDGQTRSRYVFKDMSDAAASKLVYEAYLDAVRKNGYKQIVGDWSGTADGVLVKGKNKTGSGMEINTVTIEPAPLED